MICICHLILSTCWPITAQLVPICGRTREVSAARLGQLFLLWMHAGDNRGPKKEILLELHRSVIYWGRCCLNSYLQYEIKEIKEGNYYACIMFSLYKWNIQMYICILITSKYISKLWVLDPSNTFFDWVGNVEKYLSVSTKRRFTLSPEVKSQEICWTSKMCSEGRVSRSWSQAPFGGAKH